MSHFDKNLSSSSSQDDISLFLHQILLRSSSSSSSSSHLMPGSILSNPLQHANISPLHPITRPNPSSSVGGGLSGNDTDEYDCESEEGVEVLTEEAPTKSVASRSSSKRSRAAEVHNLSEKRRRSRINEKMKALQNLIPNSNKTDKASMLDEAIEYLKQLQLQVQMLSLKNGLSLHPMCYPEGLQPLSLSRLSMELSDGNRSTPLNMTSTLPHPQDNNPLLYASNLPNKNTLTSQPSMSSYPSYVNNNLETSFAVESRIPSHKRPLQQTSETVHGEDMLQNQQSNAIYSATNLLGGSQGVEEFEAGTMAAPSTNNSLQTCIAGRDQSNAIMRNSEPNAIFTS
ncbi:unnamed protein product [Lathyrus oleraceus]|uniref:BHLH domain-containing protein n=2 Tax=Pisum sativum TaxID=3888 RepID=A0A9D5BCP9_PEA|nr:transcription factor ALC-like [Pisum sativum]KAI5439310.1 hypothetical protein KIW84_024910 [Pisum sativum]